VYRDTPAAEMGLQPGDRIMEINGQQVQSTQDFISHVRQMRPGEEVELNLVRNNNERNVSGELESRQEALELRNQQFRQQQTGGWDSRYSDRRGQSFTSDYGRRQGDVIDRITAIERQLDNLVNELRDLRASLREPSNRSWDRETAASYEEDPFRRERDSRSSARQWQDENPRQYDGYERGRSSRRFGEDRSPGGETGEDRLRPNPDQLNER
jgi:hypothetical protein